MTRHQAGPGDDDVPGEQADRPDQDGLAEQLSTFARLLEAEDDPDALLEEIVHAAVELVPGTSAASVSLVVGRAHVISQHPTGDLPQQVDALQTELHEGPCLDAVYQQQTVQVPDMAGEQRWPRFAARASAAGAASMMSFQLYVEGDNLGALNLFGTEPDAFDEESEHTGLLLASHASVAFAGTQKVSQLHEAVEARDGIGQAKGILMERFQIDADQAFRVLLRVSQNTNRKLREVASELARSRQLPGLPGDARR